MKTDLGIKKRRLLVLTSTFPRWSGDREPPFVFELSRRLVDEFEVLVLSPHAFGAKHHEEMAGIEVQRFRYFFTSWQKLAYDGGVLANLGKNRLRYLLVPFFFFFQLLAVIRILRTTKIDVIHAHWLIPQGLAALVARAFVPKKEVAILCTSHGGDIYGLTGRLLSWIKREIIKRSDKMTVVSLAMADYVNALSGRSDVEVISMGVDLCQTFTPDPEIARDPCEILFVGRLVEKKGVRYAILAMPEILATHPQARLSIVGNGPDRATLEQLARSVGVETSVQFFGAVSNAALPAFYRRATLSIVPSVVARSGDQEGLGLVLAEALGCECPVVASDLPAIRDVVIDGATGLICRQKDSADLAIKILFLLDHPERRKSLGQAGRQYVLHHFDWQIVSYRYQQLINQLSL